MTRDALGQALAVAIDEMTGGGDNAFTIRLKEPFPLLFEGLAKVSSLAPFMMPERMAKTDRYQQITDTVGSGPFKFVRDEFEPTRAYLCRTLLLATASIWLLLAVLLVR